LLGANEGIGSLGRIDGAGFFAAGLTTYQTSEMPSPHTFPNLATAYHFALLEHETLRRPEYLFAALALISLIVFQQLEKSIGAPSEESQSFFIRLFQSLLTSVTGIDCVLLP